MVSFPSLFILCQAPEIGGEQILWHRGTSLGTAVVHTTTSMPVSLLRTDESTVHLRVGDGDFDVDARLDVDGGLWERVESPQ